MECNSKSTFFKVYGSQIPIRIKPIIWRIIKWQMFWTERLHKWHFFEQLWQSFWKLLKLGFKFKKLKIQRELYFYESSYLFPYFAISFYSKKNNDPTSFLETLLSDVNNFGAICHIWFEIRRMELSS